MKKKTNILRLIFASIVLYVHAQAVFAQLPKEAQADLLQQDIVKNLKQGNVAKADDLFNRYEALGVKMPAPLILVRAQVSAKQSDFTNAKKYLESYIAQAERGSKKYQEALSMYTSIDEKVDQKLALEADARRNVRKKESQRIRLMLQQSPDSVIDMVTIKGGAFEMGIDKEQFKDYHRETPVHDVMITSFKLAKFELTNELAEAVMGYIPEYSDNASSQKIGFPVHVSILDDKMYKYIDEFIVKLNVLTGRKYRLPSESEWEYSARAGTGTLYYWGNTAYKSKANFAIEGSEKAGGSCLIKSVGSYMPNPWGLYDMYGNTSELVQDCYDYTYDGAPTDGSPKVDCKENARVVRGGNACGWSRQSTSYHRGKSDYAEYQVGLRLAHDL